MKNEDMKIKMQDLKAEIKNIARGTIRFDEPLSAHTSLKIGGPVDIMAFPDDPLSLKNIIAAAVRRKVPVFIFGGGTNLLAGDEKIRGVALSMKEFRKIEFTRDSDGSNAVLYVGAGVPLAYLINFAQQNGYAGLEALAGIPGYVGGAVFMNAGSYGTEIKDVILSVAVMDNNGDIKILDRDKLDFSYRSSGIPQGSIILSVNIILKKDDPGKIKKRISDFLLRKKSSQPLGELSAGCVFKNPDGDAAGRLIDASGCKGLSVGDAEVSSVHANYFINRGRATCRDFMKLMDIVKTRVAECSGISLEPEIRIIGEN